MRDRLFASLLGELEPRDFHAAIEEIILNDEWFPTVARIREVVKIMQDRNRVFITGGNLTVYDEIERIKNTETTWRAPRTVDGRVDLDALYRESRILRGLDPDVDDRPTAPTGWKTLAKVFA